MVIYNMDMLQDVELDTDPVVSETDIEPKMQGEDFGMASLLRTAIEQGYTKMDLYDSIIAQAQQVEREYSEQLAEIISDVKTESNVLIGKLQAALQMVDPNTNSVQQGQEVTEDDIEDEDRIPIELTPAEYDDTIDSDMDDEFLNKYIQED